MRFVLIILSICLYVCAYDMIVGDTVRRKMVYHQRVKDFALPFMKRIKTISYTDPEHRIIKGVAVLDSDFSHATANITSGGVGFDHVTVRMKSQRHHPLNYQLEIYI